MIEESNKYFWTISKKNFEVQRIATKKHKVERCARNVELDIRSRSSLRIR